MAEQGRAGTHTRGRATGRAGGRRRGGRSRRGRAARRRFARQSVKRLLQVFLLATLAALAVLAVVGRFGERLAPVWLLVAMVATVLVAVPFALAIESIRRRLGGWRRGLPDLVVLLAIGALVWWQPPQHAIERARALLGGERATQVRVVRHQVYAAYRRMDRADQRVILERARVFAPTIEEAAQSFAIDPELMMGIAATESSFHPRPSRDGGQGLFQITAVPESARKAAQKALGETRLDPVNQRHNAFLAAATLAEYRRQMDGDLFLTLLAYNIGPRNGGLRTIMETYGARNFAQAQPYLQELPRDYPVRVLVAALAWRVWTRFGALPAFEEGETARRIQGLGIPGMDEPTWLEAALSGAASGGKAGK